MVDYNSRVLVCARTRAGKSELLNLLFSGLRCQRVLVDPKDEFAVAHDAGDGSMVPRVTSVDAIDWSERTVHVVPAMWDRDEWEALFGAAFRRRRLNLTIHEAAYTCEFRPGSVGPLHNTYISQGEAHGLGYWAATQRPVCLPTFATSEPGHVFAFAEKMTRPDDHGTLAAMLDLEPTTLGDVQRQLIAEHGGHEQLDHAKHAFVWFDRSTGRRTSWAPLPAELRARNCVTRRTVE